ncbi:MAG: AAA family ATPase [Euryarchaeota archaeon]|nr:AAA family ATPase [Euryarchaeota archaeon]
MSPENLEVFHRLHLPRRLVGREEAMRSLASAGLPLLRGEAPSNLVLLGPPGSGKTLLARVLLHSLEAQAPPGSRLLYLDGARLRSPALLLTHVAWELGLQVPFTGWPLAKICADLRRALEAQGGPVLLVLDGLEAGWVRGGEPLHTLSRLNSELPVPRLSLLVVSRDLRLLQSLDSRVASSLEGEEVVLPPYTEEEVVSILEERLRESDPEATREEGALRQVAAWSFGDASRALALLRGAIARGGGVTASALRECRPGSPVEESLVRMATPSKLVLCAALRVARGGTCTTGALYREYGGLCRTLGVPTLTSRRVSGLLSDLESQGYVEAPVVSRGRGGRSRSILLRVPLEELQEALLQDPALSPLAREAAGAGQAMAR